MYGGNGRGCRRGNRDFDAGSHGRVRGRGFCGNPAMSPPRIAGEPVRLDTEAQVFGPEDEMRMLEEEERVLTQEMDDLTMIIGKLKKNKEVNE